MQQTAPREIDGVTIPQPRETSEERKLTAWLMRSLQGVSQRMHLPMWLVMVACVLGQTGSSTSDSEEEEASNEKALTLSGVVALSQ